METRFCDWHTHLNFSKDSPLSVQEYFSERLPRVIKDIWLAGVSITDHNTLRAYTVGQAEEHLRKMNERLDTRVKLLLGTEISLDVMIGERKQHVHFLFYHPNTRGSLEKTASWLEDGLLGEIMGRIIEQNNERHRIMAQKAAECFQMSRGDAESLIWLIEKERGNSPETGREHVKKALKILVDGLEDRVLDTLFSRPDGGGGGACYVPTDIVKGKDVLYMDALMALKKEYRMGMTVMAHPWRYDSKFEFADQNKAADNMLLDMGDFVPRLAEEGLIKGIEVYGYYPIPGYLRRMRREDLLEKNVPRRIVKMVRRPVKYNHYSGRRYLIKHARYTGIRYRELAAKNGLIPTGGNDSHGEELPGGKPDIPIGYGCKETDPLPYYMTGVHHTPARPLPSLGFRSN